MIGILLLGLLIVALYASWILMRWVASIAIRRQQCVAAVLVCIVLLVPIQLYTGYSLALSWGPLIIFALAGLAYVLLMFLLWHKDRALSLVGLALLGACVVVSFFGWSVVLAMVIGKASEPPIEEGRISPIASYRIVKDPGIWGGSTATYNYEIHKNPRWLPSVWKKVDENKVPCGTVTRPYLVKIKGFQIKAGANDHTIVLSCTEPESEARSWQVPID